MRARRLSLTVAAAIFTIDLVSKEIVARALSVGHPVRVNSFITLDLYYNHAGAGNSLEGRAVLVSLLAILAVVVIGWASFRVRSRASAVGIGLLLGAGLGNLSDRIFGSPGPLRGGVIDWLSLWGSRGSMNLADLSINVGVAVLLLNAAWGLVPRRARVSPASPS